LLGQDVSVLSDLEEKGQITTELLLRILFQGEWIPEDVDLKDLGEAVKKIKKAKEEAMMKQQEMQNANQAGTRPLASA
jgi:hypothetical protein